MIGGGRDNPSYFFEYMKDDFDPLFIFNITSSSDAGAEIVGADSIMKRCEK